MEDVMAKPQVTEDGRAYVSTKMFSHELHFVALQMKADSEGPLGLYTYIAITLAGTPPEERHSDKEWQDFVAEHEFEICAILHKCLGDGTQPRGFVVPYACLN
jgi:hypothetical protein